MIQIYRFRVQGGQQLYRAKTLCETYPTIFTLQLATKKKYYTFLFVAHEYGKYVCLEAQNYVQYNEPFYLHDSYEFVYGEHYG